MLRGAIWLAAAAALALAMPARAGSAIVTDANILTAIDESASVGRHEEWLQYTGLAEAVRNPAFLDAVRQAGPRGAIGFSVVAWSTDGAMRVVVPWTVITSADDAARIAERIRTSPRTDRSSWGDADDSGTPLGSDAASRPTDISATIDAAAQMTLAAPFTAARGVINILSDGPDNVGQGPRGASQSAVSQGLTINGVVFGGDETLADYFRGHVIGGIGAFVESAHDDPQAFSAMMVRKFLQDLMM